LVLTRGIFTQKIGLDPKVFPYNLMLHIGTVVNEINGQHISTIPVTVSVNVAGLIFEVLVHLCLFIVTLYLLDNKVDI